MKHFIGGFCAGALFFLIVCAIWPVHYDQNDVAEAAIIFGLFVGGCCWGFLP